jgi:hypothetical protein
MPRFKKTRASKAERRTVMQLKDILAAYADRRAGKGTRAWNDHLDATQIVDDLAFHEPDLFWQFLELAAASDIDLDNICDLGWGPLTWLLRLHPDDYVEKVASAARRDPRLRWIVGGVDQDRVAPDIWRRLRSAGE